MKKSEALWLTSKKSPTLRLIQREVELLYGTYSIFQDPMIEGTTIALSTEGLIFKSYVPSIAESLIKVWIRLPNYWKLKSKYVDYQRNDPPQYLHVLSRIISLEEVESSQPHYEVHCENLTIDPTDIKVLEEYLS